MTGRRTGITLAVCHGLAGVLPAVAQRPVQGPKSAMGPVTAFVNVGVIPMDRERVLADQTVLVQGERIVALGPAARVPASAVRIDGQGKYLIPGLADCHAHLALVKAGQNWRASDTVLKAWERDLFLYVANGVTTIRNMNKGMAAAEWLRMRDLAAGGRS